MTEFVDSIAAIATASGAAGIGILRVSGPACGDIARRMLGKDPTPRYAHYLSWRDDQGDLIEQGLLLYFAAPHSFTGEDVLEFQGHGRLPFFPLFNTFYNTYLPFELTNAQKRALKEIRKDAGSGKQMKRLLQGDVGSGKTIVALMLMLIAADDGFQSVLMTPTEILAQQHFNNIAELLKDMPVCVKLLTGSSKGKERKEILKLCEDGSLNILIGTHAVIEEDVLFKNLGFSVIDEQHKFGVAQRARLWKKNTIPPHVLVMTATPIPRSLAMTVS